MGKEYNTHSRITEEDARKFLANLLKLRTLEAYNTNTEFTNETVDDVTPYPEAIHFFSWNTEKKLFA